MEAIKGFFLHGDVFPVSVYRHSPHGSPLQMLGEEWGLSSYEHRPRRSANSLRCLTCTTKKLSQFFFFILSAPARPNFCDRPHDPQYHNLTFGHRDITTASIFSPAPNDPDKKSPYISSKAQSGPEDRPPCPNPSAQRSST